MTTLAWALAAGASCGVTRLADVTRLDRIGVPVFQAVRPWSRGLSVHQGKALTPEAAKTGALMEAVESDHAETFLGQQRVCAFEALAQAERAPSLADFASRRSSAPGMAEPMAWALARRVIDDRALWVPFDVVSLDFTRRGDARLDRSSNGLGAGRHREPASVTALLEVVERDAVQVWRASPIQDRSLDRVAAASVPFDWFQTLLERMRSSDLSLSIYRAPAVAPIPVFVAELAEHGADGRCLGRVLGASCRPSPEDALLRAVVEAAQSRLTAISGVRDDILLPEAQPQESGGFGLALPLPSHLRALHWDAVQSAFPQRHALCASDIAALLARAGFADAALVDLSRAGADVAVVKAVVPGLAAFGRGRRRLMAVAPC